MLANINPVTAQPPVSVEFKGILLDRPCQIAPESVSQEIIFFETPARQFWDWPGKSYNKKFTIKLVNCHATTIGKVVKLTFTGQEESELPGFLKVTGINNGRLGIGILDTDGVSLLKLGQPHHLGNGDIVTANDVLLNFLAYVQATPSAIKNKTVTPGEYSAIATFELNYQ